VTTVNGLPAHILLVHAIVVLLPLACALLVVTAAWPAARQHLAGFNALLAIGVLALVPITTDAGEWLERRVPETALLRDHTELGDTALWVAVPVAVIAPAIWWRGREAGATRRAFLAPRSSAISVIVLVVAVATAGIAVYDVYRTGDSGSKAAWHGQFSSTPRDDGPRRPHS